MPELQWLVEGVALAAVGGAGLTGNLLGISWFYSKVRKNMHLSSRNPCIEGNDYYSQFFKNWVKSMDPRKYLQYVYKVLRSQPVYGTLADIRNFIIPTDVVYAFFAFVRACIHASVTSVKVA